MILKIMQKLYVIKIYLWNYEKKLDQKIIKELFKINLGRKQI